MCAVLRLQRVRARSTAGEASYNFNFSLEFPGFGGSGVRTFSGAGAAFCCQNQAVDSLFPPDRPGRGRALLLGLPALGSGQDLPSKFQQLLPVQTHVGSNNHIAQSGLGGELFVSAWGGGGRVHSFPNKRLIICPWVLKSS